MSRRCAVLAVWAAVSAATAQVPPEAMTLGRQVGELLRDGRPQDALAVARRRLELVAAQADPPLRDLAACRLDVAALLQSTGSYHEAAAAYRAVCDELGPRLGHVALAGVLTSYAATLRSLARYDRAQEALGESLQLWRTALGAAAAERLASDQPDDGTAVRVQRAGTIWTQANGWRPPDFGATLLEQGALAEALGHTVEAERAYRASLAVRRKLDGDHSAAVAQTLGSLAGVLCSTGRYEQARTVLSDACALWREAAGPDHPSTLVAQANLATLECQAGRLGEAERIFRGVEAQLRAVAGERQAQRLAVLGNLAGVLLREDRVDEAVGLGQELVQVSRAVYGARHPAVAAALNRLGVAHQCQGRLDLAEGEYRQAIELVTGSSQGEHPDLALMRGNLSLLLASRGRWAEALAEQDRCMMLEQERIGRILPTLPAREQLACLSDLRSSLDLLLAQVGHRSDQPEAVALALTWLLRRKANGSAALYAQHHAIARTEPRVVALLDQLNENRRRYAAATGAAAAGPNTWREAIDRDERALAALGVSQGELLQSLSVQTDAVRRTLAPDAALVVAAAYGDVELNADGRPRQRPERYAAVVLRPSGPAAWVDLGAREQVDATVSACREALARGVGTDRGVSLVPSVGSGPDAVASAARQLWQPLAAALHGARQVYLALDGELALLPFAALPGPNGYLVEDHTFTYLDSGRELVRPLPAPAAPSSITIVAGVDYTVAASDRSDPAGGNTVGLEQVACPPLPGAAAEGRAIEALATQAACRVTFLRGGAATKAAVAATWRPTWLHLATHGFFLGDTADPTPEGDSSRSVFRPTRGDAMMPASVTDPMLRSGLLLAGAASALRHGGPGGSAEGVLTAAEVAGMDLEGTRLVTLSACDTGLGEVQRHEGVLGLRRAFAAAGAQNLLVSLWPVPDQSTRELMVAVYRRLLSNPAIAPAEALAEAQRECLQGARTRHESTAARQWAGFVAQRAR